MVLTVKWNSETHTTKLMQPSPETIVCLGGRQHMSSINGEQLTAIPDNEWVNGTRLKWMLWIPSSWSFILRKCPDSLLLFSKSWHRWSLLESLSCQYVEVFMWLLGRCCQTFPDPGKSFSPPVLLAPTKVHSKYLITPNIYITNLTTILFLLFSCQDDQAHRTYTQQFV